MELNEIELIRSCLDIERNPFAYFKDKYAFLILAEKLKNKASTIAEIKKSEFGFLLEKQEVKKLTSHLTGKVLTSDLLKNYWPAKVFDFEIELGTWGEFTSRHRKDAWLQTCRPGFNLVLKLNFSLQHDVPYYKLLQPTQKLGPFAYKSHPISRKCNTLAWARLDIDLEKGEVLIEEIQNDWLREARSLYQSLLEWKKKKHPLQYHWAFTYEMKSDFEKFERYYKQTLLPYYSIWDEAMLAAVLEFTVKELGISNVFMHHFDTGNKLKELAISKPPRSLYTKLPRRFGFKLTDEPPKMMAEYPYLKKVIRRSSNLRWYNLQL